MRWSNVIWMSCLLALTSCGHPKSYERHVQAAYDETGAVRPGYATINLEFLDALNDDLQACYRDKQP